MTERIRLHFSILNDLNFAVTAESSILDFGCGEGETVQEYRSAGFKAFGVDFDLHVPTSYLRSIDSGKRYRIPFPDATFDFVFSNSVFEHVQNYSDALSEIWRVLKPGGVSLHFFPPKWIPIEPHLLVPLGGIFQAYPCLLMWAFLGVRNRFQKSRSYRTVAAFNHDYLKTKTNYLSKRQIYKHILEHFKNVVSAEGYMIKHSYGRARYLYPFAKIFPFIVPMYRTFHTRVIVFTK